MQNFRALGAPPPHPRASGGLGLCPQTPSLRRLGASPPDPHWPPAAGGSAPRPPNTAPHCEFLTTGLLICTGTMNEWSKILIIKTRSGVEDTRLEAKAKDSPSGDRPSRGQGKECSRPRPRTKDTSASVLQKKNVFKKFFQAFFSKKLLLNFFFKQSTKF